MAQVTLDQIMADAKATVDGVAGITEVYWPPPENAPTQGPAAWLDCGPVSVEQGSLEVAIITITITVATPAKGRFGDNYKLVLDYAQRVQRAFRANTLVAAEAPVIVGAEIRRPVAGTYGGSPENAVVVCEYVMQVETLDEVVNEIVL